jgi:hypothetical protein
MQRRHALDNTQIDRNVDTGLFDPLHLPRETRLVHQALQSLQHRSDASRSVSSLDGDVVADAIKFHDYLWDLINVIWILEAQHMCS